MLAPPEEQTDHAGAVNYSPTSQDPFDFLVTDTQREFIPNSSLSSTSYANYLPTIFTTTADVEIGSMNLGMMTTQSLPQFLDTSFPDMANENIYQLACGCPPQQLLEKNLYYFVGACPSKQHQLEQNNPYYVVDGFPQPKQPPTANFHLINGCPQNPQRQQDPLMGYTNLKNQVPCINQQTLFSFHGPNLEYQNPTGNPMDPNWEAISSYLLGRVRPGPDIARIYKCSVCGVEFPNAQAFGGHMSAHRRTKKREKLEATKHQSKRLT